MSKVLVTADYLGDIADAIRGKLDVETQYKPGQMAGAIESIPSGGITPTGTINITENGTVDVTQYATANVKVSGGGGATILSGMTDPTAAQGSDGGIYLKYRDISAASVLLHFEDSTIVDEANNTTWSMSGNASISTGQAKFGTKSLYLNGGYALSASNSIFQVGDSDFTIDFWIYPTNDNRGALWGYSPIYRMDLQRWNNKICVDLSSTGSSFNIAYVISNASPTSVPANTWTHIALVRNGDTFTMYINGVANFTVTVSAGTSIYGINTDKMVLGIFGDLSQVPYNGYIDEFRFINGYAAWMGNFTPPQTPYTVSGSEEYKIVEAKLKVSGAWQDLIGSDISDVGGVTA